MAYTLRSTAELTTHFRGNTGWNGLLTATVRLTLDMPRPSQVAQQLPPRLPGKMQHIARRQSLRLLPGIRLHPPADVRTSPGPQPITARGIPNENNRGKGESIHSQPVYEPMTRRDTQAIKSPHDLHHHQPNCPKACRKDYLSPVRKLR